MIVPLNLPKAKLRLKRKENQVYVWCIVRQMDLLCTPEEWVRQHVIHFLIEEKNVPKGLIASEYVVEYNGLKKRADIVVFDRDHSPVLIVECKAPEVPINEKVLQQIATYNSKLNVPFLYLTNGLTHEVIGKEKDTWKKCSDLPNYPEMLSAKS